MQVIKKCKDIEKRKEQLAIREVEVVLQLKELEKELARLG